MNNEKAIKPQSKKGFLRTMIDKLDKFLQEKAKDKSSCCAPDKKDASGSSCCK